MSRERKALERILKMTGIESADDFEQQYDALVNENNRTEAEYLDYLWGIARECFIGLDIPMTNGDNKQ